MFVQIAESAMQFSVQSSLKYSSAVLCGRSTRFQDIQKHCCKGGDPRISRSIMGLIAEKEIAKNKSERRFFDLVVIGGGSAGLTSAFFAARLGVPTCIIEKDNIGGDCTWHGCVPSKALIKCSKEAHHARNAEAFGVSVEGVKVNWKRVEEYVLGAIDTIYRKETPEELSKSGVQVIKGVAEFLSKNKLRVTSSDESSEPIVREIEGKSIIICTGASGFIPKQILESGFPFLTYYNLFQQLSSFDSFVEGDRLAVIGGGPIGCEMAQALNRLGVKVIIVAQSMLPKEDPRCVQVIGEVFEAEGIEVTGSRLSGLSMDDNGYANVMTENGTTYSVKAVLVATGRKPDLTSLKLEAGGIRTENGVIKVDKYQRTSASRVFAAGDCTGAAQFTHFAGVTSYLATRNALLPLAEAVNPVHEVPRVTFTDPEVAQVGMSFEECKANYGNKAAMFEKNISDIDRGVCEGEVHGFIRLIYTRERRIRGATIVASRAGELAGEIGVAIAAKLKLDEIAKVIHAYPSYSFAIQEMAAEVATEGILSGFLGSFVKRIARS